MISEKDLKKLKVGDKFYCDTRRSIRTVVQIYDHALAFSFQEKDYPPHPAQHRDYLFWQDLFQEFNYRKIPNFSHLKVGDYIEWNASPNREKGYITHINDFEIRTNTGYVIDLTQPDLEIERRHNKYPDIKEGDCVAIVNLYGQCCHFGHVKEYCHGRLTLQNGKVFSDQDVSFQKKVEPKCKAGDFF